MNEDTQSSPPRPKEEEERAALAKRLSPFRPLVQVQCKVCGLTLVGRIALNLEEARRFLAEAERGPVTAESAVHHTRYCGLCDRETEFRVPIMPAEGQGTELPLPEPAFATSKRSAQAEPAVDWLVDSRSLIRDAVVSIQTSRSESLVRLETGPSRAEQRQRQRIAAGRAHWRGEVHRTRGEVAEAVAAFREAIRVYDELELPLDGAGSRLECARSLRHEDRDEAHSLLQEALAALRQPGAAPWVLREAEALLAELESDEHPGSQAAL